MEVSPETLKVNDTVTLGRYYINDDTHKEPVEWRVLALKDHKALLISKYALGAKTLENSYSDDTSWAESTLRVWLNWEFFQEVFSGAEKGRIVTSLVKNQGINEFRINSGADTYVRVFLLSVDEARAYFKDANDRLVQPTPYAKRHGTWAGTYSGNTWWWLRTRGRFTNHFAYVDNETDIRVKGLAGSNYYGAVRPALWFNLKDLKNESLKTK
ncbi:MAG: DUF6273 domain-containing protein [Succinivibrionaceae bacterium]|nr:DUF6273 domain-containing protein [Succinivibrionaceae bacterium]